MQQLKILNKKEVKEIQSKIFEQWGAILKLDYAFLKNQKNKVFFISNSISELSLDKLKINSIGMYFCEIADSGIRLSIEGSQTVGPQATKNTIEINKEQEKKWFKGENLEINVSYSGFVILKHKNDFLGSGRYKNGTVLNYIGKERRVNAF